MKRSGVGLNLLAISSAQEASQHVSSRDWDPERAKRFNSWASRNSKGPTELAVAGWGVWWFIAGIRYKDICHFVAVCGVGGGDLTSLSWCFLSYK